MKASIALILVLAAVLTGCSRPVVKETVIERPVVVERSAAAGGTAPVCTHASQTYSQGSIACQDRNEFRCGDNGAWQRTYKAC